MSNVRLAVIFLGLTLLGCLFGIIGLSWDGRPIPDILQNIASGALAGLIGLLVPARGGPGE